MRQHPAEKTPNSKLIASPAQRSNHVDPSQHIYTIQIQKIQPPHRSLAELKEQLLDRNVKRFRGGLIFKAHRLLYHSNSRLESNNEKKKKEKGPTVPCILRYCAFRHRGATSLTISSWG